MRANYPEDPSQEIKNRTPVRAGQRNRDVSASQDIIYEFLMEIVRSWQPDRTLEHFKNLFIYNTESSQFPCAGALPRNWV